jgi:hypothetical protein
MNGSHTEGDEKSIFIRADSTKMLLLSERL